MESEEVYIWGEYDGSGDPIKLTFASISTNLYMIMILRTPKSGIQ